MRSEAMFENGPRKISWDGDVEALMASSLKSDEAKEDVNSHSMWCGIMVGPRPARVRWQPAKSVSQSVQSEQSAQFVSIRFSSGDLFKTNMLILGAVHTYS